MNERQICWIICFAVSLSIFLPVFLIYNLPEIERASYTPSTCTFKNSTITTKYCCSVTCTSCSESPSNIKECGSLVDIYNSRNPSNCSSTNSCAVDGEMCYGGYKCCTTCCQTCKSCSTSCDSKGNNCKESCTSYDCNCYCCSDVNHLLCNVNCPICYTVVADVSFILSSGSLKNGTVTQDMGPNNSHDAQSFLDTHKSGFQQTCYYNPKDPNTVLLDISYTPSKWVWFAFGTLPLFVTLVYGSYIVLDEMQASYIPSNMWFIWVGIVFPIVIFLPIRIWGILDYTGTRVFTFLICILVGIGYLPVYVNLRSLSVFAAVFLYLVISFIPFSILLPFFIIEANGPAIAICSIISLVWAIFSPIFIVNISEAIKKFQERLAERSRVIVENIAPIPTTGNDQLPPYSK
ncbi:hypothetical protein HDV01_005674 [Terramyces sp. JEL0728]|nr:hypothetical protein HDV01_005674 [Terramyces sp. JEL0728]